VRAKVRTSRRAAYIQCFDQWPSLCVRAQQEWRDGIQSNMRPDTGVCHAILDIHHAHILMFDNHNTRSHHDQIIGA